MHIHFSMRLLPCVAVRKGSWYNAALCWPVQPVEFLIRQAAGPLSSVVYGGLYRSPRDNKLWTRSDPEGSSRSSGLGRRGVAGTGRHPSFSGLL